MKTVLGLFAGPVESFPSRILSCSRHECTYDSPNPISRNSEPPGVSRHIRSHSRVPCRVVPFRLHRFDERRNARGEGKSSLIGNARGKRHESEFWKCRSRIQQSANLDPDEHRHGAGHHFPGEFQWCGFRRGGGNAFSLHCCRPEQRISNPICTGDRRKCFRKHVHRQQCHEFSLCYFA